MRIVLFILVVVVIASSYYFFVHKKKGGTISSGQNLVSYYIGNQKVDEKKFLELKNALVIETEPISFSNFETAPGVFGGSEVHYKAIRIEGGKEYQYSIMNFADGHISYSIISE